MSAIVRILLEDLENELLANQFYLKHRSPESKSEQLLTSPQYQNLLTPYFTSQSLDLTEWMNTSYQRNPLHPSIQLITTFETKDHPLTPKTIEAFIEQYFL